MSQADPIASEFAPAAPSLGARLRAARLTQLLPLEDIANQLCIRASHLRALEEGDYAALPGLVYARGFVRSYAEFLKLDPKATLEQFRLETADQAEPMDTVYMPSDTNNQLPGRWMMGAAVVVMVLVIVIWSSVSTPTPPEEMDLEIAGTSTDLPIDEGQAVAPALNKELQVFSPSEPALTLSPNSAPDAGSQAVAPATAPAAAVPPASVAPAIATPTVAVNAETTPATNVAPIKPVTPAPANVNASAKPAKDAAPTDIKPVAEAPKPSGITLTADSDAWVKITDPAGNVVISRVLRTGQSYTLPQKLFGSFLSTGNAGGLRAALNGQPLGFLGKQGEVINGIVLDADELRSRAINHNL
jgi:cytoskeleton protein RodZ